MKQKLNSKQMQGVQNSIFARKESGEEGWGVMPAQHRKCDVCFSSVAGNFVMKRMNLKITDINLYGRVAFRTLCIK